MRGNWRLVADLLLKRQIGWSWACAAGGYMPTTGSSPLTRCPLCSGNVVIGNLPGKPSMNLWVAFFRPVTTNISRSSCFPVAEDKIEGFADPRFSRWLMTLTYLLGGVGLAVGIGTVTSDPPSLSLAVLLTVGGAGIVSFLRHAVFHRSDAARMGWDYGRTSNDLFGFWALHDWSGCRTNHL